MVSLLPATRTALPVAGLLALASLVVAQPAPPPAAPAAAEPRSVTELRTPQEQNADLFRQFQRELLALAQKLERSDRLDDKERAKVIYAALDLSRKENVQSQFEKMIAGMRNGTGNLRDLDQLTGQDAQLQKVLREILTVLMTDDESARLKAEIASLDKYLKEVRAIKRAQDIVRGMTEAQRVAAERIAKDQRDLAVRTRDLADRMAGGKKPDGKQGDPNGRGEEGEAKSAPKPEAKDGDAAGGAKADTQEAKADAKSAQNGGDPKDGGEAGAKPKGGSKDGMPPEGGASKAGADEEKAGDASAPRDSGVPKGASDGAKPSQEGDKPGSEAKPGAEGSKPGGEGKPGAEDEKPGRQQAGKPADGKSQGQGKGSDKQSAGQQGGLSRDKGQQGQQNQQQANSKGAGQQAGQQQGGQQSGQQGGQQGQQAQQQQQPGRKQLQEAYPHQQAAEQDLKKNDRNNAGKKEDKAIEALAKAIEELEKRLKQLREEEMLKLLANLEARCNRMLAMQIEVYETTKAIDGVVAKNGGTKTTAEIQKSQQQAQKEGGIVSEATKALKLLESEGSAVAFARVLEEVCHDMMAVQRRLDSAYVDRGTQAIEENVIALLKEMVAALKKAQLDIQQQQQQQQQQSAQKPGNQKLIDLLAELKLIKALQVQVNTRTKMYGEKVGADQAADPIILAEVKQLSERQAKLQEMINKIASGENQ